MTALPPRLVIFDVDGTLVDSQNHIVASMSTAFGTVGLPLPERETLLGVVGLSLPLALARLAPQAPESTVRTMVEAYKETFGATRMAQDAPLYPGAMEVLHRLRDEPGTALGIATGKSRRGLDHMMDIYGLHGMFQTTQVADDHPSKPHPAMLLAALDATGHSAAEAVMIGDTSYDIEMARAAGLHAIGVSWGYHRREVLQAAGAHLVIDSYADLPAALGREGGR